MVDAIKAANGGTGSIDHRKLNAIITGKAKSLSISDLEAINNFLGQFGEGLADVPILDADTITRALVERGRVMVFVACRMDGDRDYTSVWDVRGFSSIVENVNLRWPGTKAVLKAEQSLPILADSRKDEDWARLLDNTDGSSCCLGAPLAFGLAEYMLASTFRVPAFKPAPRIQKVRLPFQFVWFPDPSGETQADRIPSHFALSADDLEEGDLELPDKDLPTAIRARDAQAFLAAGTVYPVRLTEPERKDYGVIVAQRREKGQVWVVVAGLSGPGTLAAAKMLGEIPAVLPESSVGKVSDPVYAVIESAVRLNRDRTRGDPRELVDQRLLLGPKVWNG